MEVYLTDYSINTADILPTFSYIVLLFILLATLTTDGLSILQTMLIVYSGILKIHWRCGSALLLGVFLQVSIIAIVFFPTSFSYFANSIQRS